MEISLHNLDVGNFPTLDFPPQSSQGLPIDIHRDHTTVGVAQGCAQTEPSGAASGVENIQLGAETIVLSIAHAEVREKVSQLIG
jgi:hypothetical protein